eukprot:m.30620 g.30620  ORF g.30620 m.30620 type:complete len:608 (-) comp8219_c0_seq1:158-1981(-)
MSKLSFRARALDVSRPMPLIRSQENPDILTDASISRGVVQLPTGMEKEEEGEVHIAKVIAESESNPLSELSVIPVPETSVQSKSAGEKQAPVETVRRKTPFRLPKQYIRTQLWEFEDETPKYDADSDDEQWLQKWNQDSANLKHRLEVTEYERLMGKLEAAAAKGMLNARDIKLLLENNDETICKSVQQRFVNRTASLNRPTITPQLKPETPDSARDAYVAFRRRTERMHTRKNQKTTESSFINMLKLRRDLETCRQLMEKVKKREELKRDLLKQKVAVVKQRFTLKDWDGALARRLGPRPPTPPPIAEPAPQLLIRLPKSSMMSSDARHISAKTQQGLLLLKRKREEETKRHPHMMKHKMKRQDEDALEYSSGAESLGDDEGNTSAATESDYDHDEPFRLRRRYNMYYHAPLPESTLRTSRVGQYALAKPDITAFPSHRPRIRGFCRRRVGRGGRIFIDRCRADYDPFFELTWLPSEQENDMEEQANRLREMRKMSLRRQREAEEQRRRQLDARQMGTPGGMPISTHSGTKHLSQGNILNTSHDSNNNSYNKSYGTPRGSTGLNSSTHSGDVSMSTPTFASTPKTNTPTTSRQNSLGFQTDSNPRS